MISVRRWGNKDRLVHEHVLATWTSGRLSRICELEKEDDSAVGDVVLAWVDTPRGTSTASGILLDVFGLDPSEHERQPFQILIDGRSDLPRGITQKIGWFLEATVLPASTEKIDQDVFEQYLVRKPAGEPWSMLEADHPLEAEARSRHRAMMREAQESFEPEGPSRDDFVECSPEENTDFLMSLNEAVMGEEVNPFFLDWTERCNVVERGEAFIPIELGGPFGQGGQIYLLVHGFLRRDTWPMEQHVREKIGKQGPMSFYVTNATEHTKVYGAGRTPREALRSVPFFTWPGDEHPHPGQGQLTFDAEVVELSRMLGEAPPPWWRTGPFLEWAKEIGL